MIFCEEAEELVGLSAEELVDKIKNDDEWFTLPNEIRALLGSTHTFEIFDKYRSGSFSVHSIMDDVTVPIPAASTTQCKKARAPKGSTKAAVPAPTTAHQCNYARSLPLRAALAWQEQGRSPPDCRSLTSVCEGMTGSANPSGHFVTHFSASRLMHPLGLGNGSFLFTFFYHGNQNSSCDLI